MVLRSVQMVSLLPVLLLPASVLADTNPNPLQYCFLGCQTALSNENFAGSPNATNDYYSYQCGNQLYVSSVYLCSKLYCSNQETQSGAAYANSTCILYTMTPLLSYEIVANVSEEQIQSVPLLSYQENISEIDTYIIPDEDFFSLGYRTIAEWYDQQHLHLMFRYYSIFLKLAASNLAKNSSSEATFIFWGVILLCGIFHNIFTYLTSSATSSSVKTELTLTIPQSRPLAHLWTRLRATLILPADFRHQCQTPIGPCTVPPRLETIIIAAFIIFNIILTAIHYTAFEDNLYYTQKSLQIWRYFSDRTGCLSYANITILWLFGIRNNILLWMTGWSFATFNRFHRWIARVVTLEAILHSIGQTVVSLMEGGEKAYYADFVEQYWYTGVIATISMSLLFGFSTFYLRVRFYDLFLAGHIALALITLVSLFYHTKIFNGEYDRYLWPCVAFWVFDRLVRLGRVAYYWAMAPKGKAMMFYDHDADLIRVDVTFILERRRPPAGSYFFIYTPTSMFGWESHPFTLVKWNSSRNEAALFSKSRLAKANMVTAASSLSESSNLAKSLGEKYSFLIRPHKGFTSRLRRSLLARPRSMTVLLEGPYGDPPRLGRFSNILFIMGGTGVTVAISSITEALKSGRQPPKMHLVWAIRSAKMLTSIGGHELSEAMRSKYLRIDTFATQDTVGSMAFGQVTVHCRPDIAGIVHDAVEACTGSLAVVVCGPSLMADDARAAVVRELKAGREYVSLFLENFSW